MQDLHWRYNFNTDQFDFVENNPNQHYEPLLKHVHIPTLVIDINLVPAEDVKKYIGNVLHKSIGENIRIQQIIFDGTQDPVNDYDSKIIELNDAAKEYGIPCYFAVSQFRTNVHDCLIEINYPSWLFVFKKQTLPTVDFSKQRQHAFSCLNRNPTFHRLMLYSMIKNAGLLDRFVYSFYDRCPYQGHKITSYQYKVMQDVVSPKLYQECLENIQDFPIAWHNEQQGINDHSIAHDAYMNTWCNIVTETSALHSFTSEKIWKPIAAGQLFLIAGASGTASWLKQLGFNVFNDEYDTELVLEQRFVKIINIIEQHAKDLEQWWKQNRFQIEQNYYHFHSGNVEKQILDPLIKQLNHK